jgi:hypothetical protein
MSGKPTYFRIEKLYLDCIDDVGNCFIIYRVKIKLSLFKVFYSGMIFQESNGDTIEISSYKKTSEPIISELLVFYNHYLGTRGTWKRTVNTLPPFIFKDERNHELIWNCHHPGALAELTYEDQTFRGFGYAETLTTTIKPWNLPIDELLWGRFLSEYYTITWVIWKGKHHLNKLFINGKEYTDPVFEPDRIKFGNGDYELVFNKISVIKKEKLSYLFSEMPWIRLFIKRGFSDSVENKFKAKSTLHSNSNVTATGWSLYEVVQWKK